MFEYIEGVIMLVKPAYVVVAANGIGYKIYSPNPYRYHEGQNARLYVEQIVRDTGISLYGFLTLADKELFLQLLRVSGIGPKSAVAIMAAEDSQSLASAIENGQTTYLTRFPGIGKKTAAQIVLDLKGKLQHYASPIIANQSLDPALKDALLALVALGYTQREVDRITPKLMTSTLTSADAYIKQGLALLLKK